MPGAREDLGQAVLELVTDPTKLRAGMAAARSETAKTLNDANAGLRSIGQKMTATGGQMTRGVTVPVLAAGAAIVSVGGDFEHTMSQIVGLVGISREQVNAWKPEIEDLARSTGIGPNELAKGLYFVASSGIDASKAMDVLTISAKASEAGMGDVEMLADVLTGTMNAYAKSNLTAAHAMDVLVRGIQVGKAEPAEFAQAMGTVAPVAAQLGVSVEDLVGSMAILSRTNSNTAENATSLGQIFNTLLKPTDQTSAALQKMGLSAAGLRDELSEKGVIAVLKTLGEHIGTDDEAIAQIFPNIRALRGVLNLTGQDAGAVAEAMDKVGHSTGALDDAVKAVADDATVKMNKAVAGLQVELIVLASDVLPLVVRMLGGLVTGIHGAVEWFTKLPAPVKEGAVTALALLAVLGPILIVLGSIVTAGTAVLGAFGTLAGFLGATLIPRFVTLLAMLAGGAVQGFASLIFATGIPALESLGVALAGVEVAAGPLLAVAAALIAIGVAASGAAPSVDDIKKQIADLEKEDGLAKLLDVNRDGRIEFLKQKLAEAEAAVAAAAAKEREQLAASQKAWADWQAEVGTTIDDIATHLGLGGVPDAVHGMVDDVAQGLKSGKYKIENGAIVMAEGIPTAVEKSGLAAVKAVKTTIGDIARAIRASRQVIVDAMTDVVNDAYDPLILAADISATKVELAEQRKIAASKGYTQAQVDAAKAHARTDAQREKADKMHTVAEVAEAKRRVLELQKQLGIQLADQTKYGDDATRLGRLKAVAVSKAMVDGLKSGDTLRKAESQKAAAELASGIVALEKSSGGYGTRTGNSYVDSLISALENKYAETKRAVGIYKNLLVASSPPGPDSPLHEIPKWGYRTGEAWVSPFGDAIAAGHARIRALVGGIRGDLDVAGGGSASLGRIERMGSIRVEHTISADGAAALAAAGLDPRQVGQALADGVNASGLFSNLQGLQALSGS